MQNGIRIKYFDATADKIAPVRAKNMHSEFLRTGRISRYEEHWISDDRRRYLTHEQVAEVTGRKLEIVADNTHNHLNSFHSTIRFPKMIFHRVLEQSPHLGYCHVTASKTSFDSKSHVTWSFYFANFFAEIGGEENFFEQINPRYSRMYFAVAMNAAGHENVSIDRSVHQQGLLFRTHDPKIAFKNVLMLGTRSEGMRKVISSI